MFAPLWWIHGAGLLTLQPHGSTPLLLILREGTEPPPPTTSLCSDPNHSLQVEGASLRTPRCDPVVPFSTGDGPWEPTLMCPCSQVSSTTTDEARAAPPDEDDSMLMALLTHPSTPPPPLHDSAPPPPAPPQETHSNQNGERATTGGLCCANDNRRTNIRTYSHQYGFFNERF